MSTTYSECVVIEIQQFLFLNFPVYIVSLTPSIAFYSLFIDLGCTKKTQSFY